MSNYVHSTVGPRQQMKATTERIKVLKVIGEAVGELALENTICINAIKVINIDAEIKHLTDHVFCNKVVKQGIVHKQVLYVDPEGVVREVQENVPFMLAVDIPGVKKTPFTEVQNYVLDIDTDFILKPACGKESGILDQKVIAHILVKVSEWTDMDIITKVEFFPKVNSFSCISCKK